MGGCIASKLTLFNSIAALPVASDTLHQPHSGSEAPAWLPKCIEFICHFREYIVMPCEHLQPLMNNSPRDGVHGCMPEIEPPGATISAH